MTLSCNWLSVSYFNHFFRSIAVRKILSKRFIFPSSAVKNFYRIALPCLLWWEVKSPLFWGLKWVFRKHTHCNTINSTQGRVTRQKYKNKYNTLHIILCSLFSSSSSLCRCIYIYMYICVCVFYISHLKRDIICFPLSGGITWLHQDRIKTVKCL